MAAVGGANGGCAETRPLDIEPEVGKVPKHVVESSLDQGRDVLAEHEPRRDLVDDSGNLGPEPAVVLDASAPPGGGEGQAGEAGRDEIHAAAPRAAVEGLDVVPHRSLIQGLVFHPRHEDGRSVGVPLDVTHSAAGVSEGEAEAQLEAADPGADGEPGEGTCSHVTPPPPDPRTTGSWGRRLGRLPGGCASRCHLRSRCRRGR